jgi:hypothetical protein
MMAFYVEDGTGVKGATSYTTVAYFKAYCADHGINLTGVLDAVIQAALINATSYIDTRWGLRLKGTRLYTYLQSRSIFSLTNQPANGNTIVVGSDTYTFKTTADETVTTEIQIGDTVQETLLNLAEIVSGLDTDDVVEDSLLFDPDVNSIAIYFSRNGIATTIGTCPNGSWGAAASTGYSGWRQPLEFPRSDVYDAAGNLVEGMPDLLKQAACEYANRARSAALAPDPSVDNSILSKSQSVGPISTSVTYNAGAILQTIKPYPAADRLLSEFVKSGGVMRN